jgi:hypothetical protein
MNNSSKSIPVILAAGAAGVAVFTLANSAFVAALPVDVFLAIGTSVAVIALAAFDYSRRPQPLALPCDVLRPSLPVATARGLKSNRNDRVAA